MRTSAGVLLTVGLIGLLWGLNWPAVKFMLTEMPPLTIRGIAFPLATVLLLIYALWRGENLRPPLGEVPMIAITGLLTIFGFNVLTTLGQMLTETSTAAIIAYTMPALTAFLSAIFLSELMDVRKIAALTIGTCAMIVLATEDLSGLLADPRGPLIMLASALSWAAGTVCLKAGRWSLSNTALTVWFLGLSAIAVWPLILIFEPPAEQNWPSMPVIAVLLYHALGPMVLCYALWTSLVGRLPASVAAIATLMAPVVGVSSAMILLGDPPTWHKAAALVMVLGSIILTFARPQRGTPARKTPERG